MTCGKWQPIETAPKDGSEILLRWKDAVAIGCWRARYEGQFRWQDPSTQWPLCDETDAADQPTRWTPLPPPPVEGE